MSEDRMTFPDTWDEYEKKYGFNDVEEIYTNGARLIPSFRVEQWLEHLQDESVVGKNTDTVRHGKWEYGEDESGYDGYYCSKCFGHVRWYGKAGKQSINFIKKYNYCPNCGADVMFYGADHDRAKFIKKWNSRKGGLMS